MALKFDEDPAGAILEYASLQRAFDYQEVRPEKTEWVAANVSPSRPPFDIWAGPALNKEHLHSVLRPGRSGTAWRKKLDRAILKLEAEQLLEPWSGDGDLATSYRTLSDLGQELWLSDCYREYIFGLPFVAKRWRDSVVKIVNPEGSGIGTGFLVAPTLVATARHVLEGMPRFVVETENGVTIPHFETRFPREAVHIDLALVRIADQTNLLPFKLSIDCDLLDEVVVFGYPPIAMTDGAYMVVNRGEISARPTLRGDHPQSVLVVSCFLRGGNSGGPVVNRRGQVVGVVSQSLFTQVAQDEKSVNESLGLAAATEANWLQELIDDSL